MKIGEIMPLDREITLNGGKESRTIAVVNTGDRPVQVGSHYHFFEVNRCLSFDRARKSSILGLNASPIMATIGLR